MTKTNFGIGTSMPEAHITRPREKSRGRVKVYSNNTIYLEKSEEFEIELFNPTQDSILAKIEINGKLISSTGLVLKPAQRVYLERYFDVDRKFKFDVYEVENWEKLKLESQELANTHSTLDRELSIREQLLSMASSEEERISLTNRINELKTQTSEMISLVNDLNNRSNSVQQATKYNGKIRILFFKEEVYRNPITFINSSFNGIYNGTINLNSLNSTGSITSNTIGGTTTSSYNTDSRISASSFSSSIDEPKMKKMKSILRSKSLNENDLSLDSLEDTKETGRIELGSVSNQKFETVNMRFESYSFHTIDYNLLPTSEKPMEVKDLRKYCTECGKKLNPSDNFCASCGTKA